MKVISWNFNGLRSLKESLEQVIDTLDGDVYCFQETKLSRNQVEEKTAFIADYSSYFAFSKTKNGYSGVVTYCRECIRPFHAQDSLSENFVPRSSIAFDDSRLKCLDSEGRTVITEHALNTANGRVNLFIINVYCPRSDVDDYERLAFKLDFYDLLESKAKNLLKRENSHVLIVGDINTSHKRIDHCEPDDHFEENPCRRWLDDLFNAEREPFFVDVFRRLYPEAKNAFSCWNTRLNARETNYGTRIDYFICDSKFVQYVDDCSLLTNVTGSDHCPILLELKNVEMCKSPHCPRLCTKFWPEFGCGKKQLKMTDFVAKEEKRKTEDNSELHSEAKKSKVISIKNYFDVCSKNETNEEKQCSEEKANNLIVSQNNEVVKQWKNVLKGPSKPPLCNGHGKPAVLRTVTKAGPNRGKQFFACSRPIGARDDRNSQCNFFQWCK